MKKIITLLLAVLMLLGLTSCNNNNDVEEPTDDNSPNYKLALVYKEEGHEYQYMTCIIDGQRGWAVMPVTNRTKTSYGEIHKEIRNRPVISMRDTFKDCTALVEAPIIPDSVIDMKNTFNGCTSLKTAPTIPSSVTNIWNTFNSCISLTGNIEVNAEPTNYLTCLEGTTQPITITGTCSAETKANLVGTANNSNVTYEGEPKIEIETPEDALSNDLTFNPAS